MNDTPNNPAPGLAQRIAEALNKWFEVLREPYRFEPNELNHVVQEVLAQDPVLREAREALAKVKSYPHGATLVQVSGALSKLDALMKGSK